jgi:ABC-type lipoprotein export system ATPase subunit
MKNNKECIIFKNIKKQNIFAKEFNSLTKNNIIEFRKSSEPIAVIYGPNGTGKTSFINVLEDLDKTEVSYTYQDKNYSEGKNIFYIIHDQNDRNIIEGEAKDFLLGDNIRREFELKDLIEVERVNLINEIIKFLKSFGISTMKSKLFAIINDEDLEILLKNIINSKKKGKDYTLEKILELLMPLVNSEKPIYEENKLKYYKEDISSNNSLIEKIYSLEGKHLIAKENVEEIEENTEAIKILQRFDKKQCIVCDTENIDTQKLLKKKESNKNKIMSSMDKELKDVIQNLLEQVPQDDIFNIKERLFFAIKSADKNSILEIITDLRKYEEISYNLLKYEIGNILKDNNLKQYIDEYKLLISQKPDIEEEDLLYIKEIISNSMSKDLEVVRDAENKNLRIQLSNQDFLEKDRSELPLSNGEQNFLSLAFEFLKAKNSSYPIIVIDDPISSFDSIYKNKVIYALIKILHNKKRIVLTHNMDCIRLLQAQYKSSFNLYLLNNVHGEENGFIKIANNELDLLISLEKLLTNFREKIFNDIKDEKRFLLSMISFMRGYANIIGKKDIYEKLMNVMHGYKKEKVNIAKVYIELFGKCENNKIDINNSEYNISVKDILNEKTNFVEIVDEKKYPLLNRTLNHLFVYLYLRLLVEKVLVEKFNIDVKDKPLQLGQIIDKAFSKDRIKERIRLTSKKTLLNEFNHFEGNLSIFQPALDITTNALNKEKEDILSFVEKLNNE